MFFFSGFAVLLCCGSVHLFVILVVDVLLGGLSLGGRCCLGVTGRCCLGLLLGRRLGGRRLGRVPSGVGPAPSACSGRDGGALAVLFGPVRPVVPSASLPLVLRVGELFVARHPLLRGPDADALVRVDLVLVLALLVHRVLWNRLHLDSRSMWKHSEILEKPSSDLLEVLWCVLVGHVGRADVQLEVRPKVLKVVVVRQLVGDVHAERHGSLVGPAARHVADGVAPSTQLQEGQVVLAHKLGALAVALQGQVEAAQSVPRERVRPALEHHCARLVHLHHLRDERLEDALV
uniref:Putative secreted protein n=1 Tax=Ixodes ricinus TaxID=34613 RepID=A0A6B0V7H8_IXORI